MLVLGGKGTCKSRLIFGSSIDLNLTAHDSIFCTLMKEVLNYAEKENIGTDGNHLAVNIGISIADVVYNDADKTEVVTDLLRIKENDNKNADLDILTNIQITTVAQFEKILSVTRVQSQNWGKKM